MPNWKTRSPKKPKAEPKEEGDFTEFDQEFLSLVQKSLPQGTVPSGWPLYRLGGSARHWTTGGSNRYVPTGFSQIGVYAWTGDDYEENDIQIIFPRQFAGKPLVWVSVTDVTPHHRHVVVIAEEIETWVFTLSWVTKTGEHITSLKVSWLAMGPGAGA
jgi:hypothetical protein